MCSGYSTVLRHRGSHGAQWPFLVAGSLVVGGRVVRLEYRYDKGASAGRTSGSVQTSVYTTSMLGTSEQSVEPVWQGFHVWDLAMVALAVATRKHGPTSGNCRSSAGSAHADVAR